MRGPQLTLALLLVLLVPAGCGPSAGSMAPVAAGTVDARVSTPTGDDLIFEPDVIQVPGGRSVTVTFENVSSQPHNLVFTGGITASTRTIVAPGATDRFVIDAPTPGEHPFVCTIHQGMTGTLVVAGSS